MTRAPSFANRSAIAAPMPLDAPVTKATLPSNVAQKISKHHGGGQMATQQLGGKGQHPGGVNKGSNAPLTTGGQAGGNGGKKDQHPGGKGQNKGQANTANTGQNSTGAGFDQHPGVTPAQLAL